MLKGRRILCPTDFSEFAKGALEQAVVLGRRYDAEIVSACVIPTLMPPTAGLPFALPPHFDAQARKATLAELDRFTEPCRVAGLKTRLEVLEGGVASSLVELAAHAARQGQRSQHRNHAGSAAEGVSRLLVRI